MSEPPPLKGYWPGDEIKATLTVRHRPNLVSVEVVFAQIENHSIVITLAGSPEPQGERGEDGYVESTAELSEVVLPKHAPGDYELVRIEFETFVGHVLYAPSDRVMATPRGFRVEGEQRDMNDVHAPTLSLD